MTNTIIPEAGDIVVLSFDPQAGREIQKRRPALVLSPKIFNATTGFAWICPITSTPSRHGFQLPIPRGIQGFTYPDAAGAVATVKIEQMRSLDYQARGAVIIAPVPKAFLNQCRSYAMRVLEG